MSKTDDNPLARLDRRKINYPLVVAAAVLCVLMLAGIGMSVQDGNWPIAGIFVGCVAIFVVIALLDVAQKRRLAALDDRKFIQWDDALPEIQRQNVDLEVRELARLLGVEDDQLADLLSAYIVAEDLALRQIQHEENLPLLRHVSIGKTPFDALLVEQDLITCIEVSFLVVPDMRQEKIAAMLKKISTAKKNLEEMKSRLRLRLMLVLVTQLTADEEEQLRAVLSTRRFSDTPVDVDIRMLDFELLQRVYVSE